jgi:hypothetical protein
MQHTGVAPAAESPLQTILHRVAEVIRFKQNV